jgi:hypothetical protein
MPVGVTWRAGEENITLDGRRKDAKEGVVDVFPDKAEKSGISMGVDYMWGWMNTYLTRPGARTM